MIFTNYDYNPVCCSGNYPKSQTLFLRISLLSINTLAFILVILTSINKVTFDQKFIWEPCLIWWEFGRGFFYQNPKPSICWRHQTWSVLFDQYFHLAIQEEISVWFIFQGRIKISFYCVIRISIENVWRRRTASNFHFCIFLKMFCQFLSYIDTFTQDF